MGWLKSAAKWVAKKAKAAARFIVRLALAFIRLPFVILDVVVGLIAFPRMKLRLHVVVLADQTGMVYNDDAQLQRAIDFAVATFKKRLNVDVVPYSPRFVQKLDVPAPDAALNVGCDGRAVREEAGDAGDFFAQHLAGWNGIPISLTFPITVFIVKTIEGKNGCSLAFATDYVTLTPTGVDNTTTMAHELGHACNLWFHSSSMANLMYEHANGRGDELGPMQKHVVRSSRHVTYW